MNRLTSKQGGVCDLTQWSSGRSVTFDCTDKLLSGDPDGTNAPCVAFLAKDLRFGHEPHGLSELDSVLGHQLGELTI